LTCVLAECGRVDCVFFFPSEAWKVTRVDGGALAAWCGAAGASLEALWSSPAATTRAEYQEQGKERLKSKPKLRFAML
jgi:actin-related protein